MWAVIRTSIHCFIHRRYVCKRERERASSSSSAPWNQRASRSKRRTEREAAGQGNTTRAKSAAGERATYEWDGVKTGGLGLRGHKALTYLEVQTPGGVTAKLLTSVFTPSHGAGG